jgi:acyl-CoA synthetase (AMP-forming)/AMP-acid ligase II
MRDPTFQLARRVCDWALRRGDRAAFVDAATGASLSYAQLARARDGLAKTLSRDLPPGATVVLQCPNCIDFPAWFLGILSAGLNVLPVRPDIAAAELRELCTRVRAAALVSAFDDDCSGITPKRLPLQGWRAGFDEYADAGNPVGIGSLLLMSSGTTGSCKIVRRTAPSLDTVADAMVAAIGFDPEDSVLASVPLSHSYGVEHGLLAPLWAGCTVRLCEGLDIRVIAGELAASTSIFPTIPPAIEMLAALADVPTRMPKLRLVYSAGGALPATVHQRFFERFKRPIGQVYGMTEIGSVTFNDPRIAPFDSGSVGRPLAGVSLRISPEDGEVLAKSPFMLDDYVDESPPALIDGHLRTGDLGRIDPENRLYITGRVRLLIEAGGRKVNPFEVEAALSAHPDVVECVVVRMRQTETIHRLRAVIVPRDPERPPPADAIRAFLRERLARFKVPRAISYRSALPRSAAGKVLRQQVEAEA